MDGYKQFVNLLYTYPVIIALKTKLTWSQNQRTVGVEKDHWRSSSPTLLVKQVP